MLHGRGNQYKYTKEYLKLRNKGLEDTENLSDQELIDAEITGDDGGGRTNEERIYRFYNHPMPADRSKKKVDRRDVYGKLGEKER